MGAAVDYEKLYQQKRKKLLEINRSNDLTDTQKRIMTYILLNYEKGETFSLTLQDFVDEINISSLGHTSNALKGLVNAGYLEALVLPGNKRTYKTLF